LRLGRTPGHGCSRCFSARAWGEGADETSRSSQLQPKVIMANLSLVRSKKDLIIALIPEAADAVFPHGPRGVTNAYVDLLIADVVKEISSGISTRALGKKVLEASKDMATQASRAMVASWEPGDDICPPWPFPWPGPGPLARQEPDPDPWKTINAAEQIEIGHILTHLAGLTTSKEFNRTLKSLATDVARGVASTLVDEFERCGTVPRKPIPRPKGPRARITKARPAIRITARGMTPASIG